MKCFKLFFSMSTTNTFKKNIHSHLHQAIFSYIIQLKRTLLSLCCYGDHTNPIQSGQYSGMSFESITRPGYSLQIILYDIRTHINNRLYSDSIPPESDVIIINVHFPVPGITSIINVHFPVLGIPSVIKRTLPCSWHSIYHKHPLPSY